MKTGWWLDLGVGYGASVAIFLSALAACAPDVRVLGDETAGSAGQPLVGDAGSGGSTAIGGSPGRAGNTGISGNGGSAGQIGSGGTSAGGAGGSSCFAPGNHPELALVAGVPGCACSNEPAQCVVVDDNGRQQELSLECQGSFWRSVEDGVCTSAASCVVAGKIYPSGSTNIPDPFSCNKCSCDNGTLGCTDIGCEIPCPDGTAPASQCLQCGPADGCLSREYKCLPTCTDQTPCADAGFCSNGICRLAPGICG